MQYPDWRWCRSSLMRHISIVGNSPVSIRQLAGRGPVMRGWRGDAARCPLSASQRTLGGVDQLRKHDTPPFPAELRLEALCRVGPISRGDCMDAAFDKGGAIGRFELLGQTADRNVMPVDDQHPVAVLFQADRVAGGDAVEGPGGSDDRWPSAPRNPGRPPKG